MRGGIDINTVRRLLCITVEALRRDLINLGIGRIRLRKPVVAKCSCVGGVSHLFP